MNQKQKQLEEEKLREDNIDIDFLELNQAISNVIENQCESENDSEEVDKGTAGYSSQFSAKGKEYERNVFMYYPSGGTLDHYHKAYLSSPVMRTKYTTPNLVQRNMYSININPNVQCINPQYFSPQDYAFSPLMPSFGCGVPQMNYKKYSNYHPESHKVNFFSINSKANDDQSLNKMLNKQSKANKNKKGNGFANQTPMTTKSLFANNSNVVQVNSISNHQMTLGHQEEKKNNISLESIIQGKDKRMTLMIRNIPNKYSIGSFLEEINSEFLDKYDVFYLPIDYENKCNLGFAFINFVEPMHIVDFYDTYRGKKWKRFNSEKICELVYAKIQGKKELISHFEKGKVLSFESEDKRPLILHTPSPLPKIVIPLKLMNMFLSAYPFAVYHPISNGKILVDSFFTF